MLRGIAFYGTATGTSKAMTFFDPILGVTVTKIPKSGSKEGIAIRGITFMTNTPAINHYLELSIGQDADYHKIAIIPRGDADSPTAGPFVAPFQSLGDYLASENFDLAATAQTPASAEVMAGVLWYDDLEPEIPIPRGRLVGLVYPGASDGATAYAASGTLRNKLGTDSVYYICGCHVVPEDKVPQVVGLHSSDKGLAAVGPPRGLLWYPSCPLVVDGLATLTQKLQVTAATKVTVIWWAVEVPKAGKMVQQVKPVTGLAPMVPGVLLQKATATVRSAGMGLLGRA